ncbi:MAG: glutaminase A [Gammaproteobacteria bacterium]|nr:glutaminase A [Gammaproteobacteria bacterium]
MSASALEISPVQRYLDELHQQLLGVVAGEVASYIPELTRSDPGWLGLALVTVDGHVYQVGDSRQPFTIQSISKALTYGIALEDRGLEHVVSKVGVEPSGEAFNSISLEPDTGRPVNPMINAGAIAVTGMIEGPPEGGPLQRILETFARYTGHPHEVDESVYRSESETGHRNRAIAHLLYGHGILDTSPETALDAYFQQCSILVTARDLAMMGACLANNGVNPVTGVVALKSQFTEKVLSVMSTCGMYDYSGAWIFDVGMPAKSGVGGGIMAVLPGQFGLGVFSPPLDEKGNSVRGIEACKRLSRDFSLHLFNVARSTSASIVRKVFDSARFGSRRGRNAREMELLSRLGQRVRIFELQGELLFGNTESVALEILSGLDGTDFVIVDLKRVVSADRASTRMFADLWTQLAGGNKHLFFTGCGHLYRFKKYFRDHQDVHQEPAWFEFGDTDHAVEWCEDCLLAEVEFTTESGDCQSELCHQYLCSGMSSGELRTLRDAGDARTFPSGSHVVRTGDPADSLYFILEGQVDVVVKTDDGHHLRVNTLGKGTAFGEMALIEKMQRTADVVAVSHTVCVEVIFSRIPEPIRTKMLVNLAGYLAGKLVRDTELVRHLG